jgi:hypothetical protein
MKYCVKVITLIMTMPNCHIDAPPSPG